MAMDLPFNMLGLFRPATDRFSIRKLTTAMACKQAQSSRPIAVGSLARGRNPPTVLALSGFVLVCQGFKRLCVYVAGEGYLCISHIRILVSP